MRTTIAIALSFAASLAAFAGFDEYKHTSFAALLRDASPDPEVDHDIWPGTEGWIVKATFTGNARAVTETHRKHIMMWLKSTGRSEDLAAMFANEVELRDGEKKYWVPVQTNLLEPLKEEVPAGTAAKFYVLHVGFCRIEPLLIMNEFEEPSPE